MLSLSCFSYGHFLEPSKTVFNVQASILQKARDLFHDLGVQVVTGSRFFGGFVGETTQQLILFLKRLRFGLIAFNSSLMLP